MTSVPKPHSPDAAEHDGRRPPAAGSEGSGAVPGGSATASSASSDASAAPSAEASATASADATATSSAGARRASAARTVRRALGLALLCGALGAALALLASGQVWSHATASFAQGGLPVKAKGNDVTGLPSALALVGLAALVAVFAVRRRVRMFVAALLALCGTGALVSALLRSRDSGALREKAAEASGLAGTGVEAVQVSAWPYVSAAGGALLLLAGVLALRYGQAWPSMSGSGRYERTARTPRGAAPADPERPEELWKALDRGEDPTGGSAD